MNKPKKHAELIKKWADGARIEKQRANGTWVHTEEPFWSDSTNYRIAPPAWHEKYRQAVRDGHVVEYDWSAGRGNAGWAPGLINEKPDTYDFGTAPEHCYRIKETKPDLVREMMLYTFNRIDLSFAPFGLFRVVTDNSLKEYRSVEMINPKPGVKK